MNLTAHKHTRNSLHYLLRLRIGQSTSPAIKRPVADPQTCEILGNSGHSSSLPITANRNNLHHFRRILVFRNRFSPSQGLSAIDQYLLNITYRATIHLQTPMLPMVTRLTCTHELRALALDLISLCVMECLVHQHLHMPQPPVHPVWYCSQIHMPKSTRRAATPPPLDPEGCGPVLM